MDKIVRVVFGMIAGAIAAAMLYALFFGTGDKRSDWFGGSTPTNNLAQDVVDNGGTIKNADGTMVYGDANGYEGAWYYMCMAFEHPIAQYYYKYCYIPNVLNDYYVDTALGLTYDGVNIATLDTAIEEVKTDLDTYDIVGDTQVNNAPYIGTDTVAAYTTGWY